MNEKDKEFVLKSLEKGLDDLDKRINRLPNMANTLPSQPWGNIELYKTWDTLSFKKEPDRFE